MWLKDNSMAFFFRPLTTETPVSEVASIGNCGGRTPSSGGPDSSNARFQNGTPEQRTPARAVQENQRGAAVRSVAPLSGNRCIDTSCLLQTCYKVAGLGRGSDFSFRRLRELATALAGATFPGSQKPSGSPN